MRLAKNENEGMNILFFLLPKQEIDFAYSDWTLRQTIEKMRAHGYSTIPILDRESGKYVRSITDGDILDSLLEKRIGFEELSQTALASIPSKRDIKPVPISADEKDLLSVIIGQNYVPVVDDKGVFIGIVTRKRVLSRFMKDEAK